MHSLPAKVFPDSNINSINSELVKEILLNLHARAITLFLIVDSGIGFARMSYRLVTILHLW